MIPPIAVAIVLTGASGFCQADVCTTAPAAHSEVSAGVGLLSTGYRHTTGIVADSFVFAGADGRWRPSAVSWLYLDAGAAGLTALSRDGSHPGVSAVARVGVRGSTLAFSLGVNAHADDTVSPLSLLPSLSLSYRSGALGITAAVLDRPVGPLARLSVEYGNFGLGYAAPLGLEAFARFRLSRATALRIGAFGYQAFQSFSAGGQVSLVVGEGALFQFGGDQ